MTFHQLQCFIVLTQVKHYTKAAQKLFITQPSLSYAISKLENELGVPLFEKSGQRIVLTRFGNAFFPYAQSALLSYTSGLSHIQRMVQPQNIINLGYIFSSSIYLSSIIKGFQESTSTDEVAIKFFQGLDNEIVDKLYKGELDLALSTFPGEGSIKGESIFEQELFLVVSNNHALANRKEVSLNDVKKEKFVSITPDSSLRALLNETFNRVGFQPNITFEAEECNAMASFVGSQFGVAIMPKIPALSSYPVSLLHIKDFPLYRTIYLLWIDSHHTPKKIEQFIKYIINNYQFMTEH